jgi:ElaB/YqjD/DUF883 family membrane-anchored ribosome-binding protein
MAQTRNTARNGDVGTESEPTSDRLATMAHETIDQVATTANRAADEVRGAATKTLETAKEAQEHVVAAADESLTKVRSYVERNPLTAVGLAFAFGALLISLVRR